MIHWRPLCNPDLTDFKNNAAQQGVYKSSSQRALYKLVCDTMKIFLQPTRTCHERLHKSMLHNRVLQIKQSESLTVYYMIYRRPGHIATRTWHTANLRIFFNMELTNFQGNLKKESVSAAILPSRMEVSYCTSGYFVAKPAKRAWGAFPVWG